MELATTYFTTALHTFAQLLFSDALLQGNHASEPHRNFYQSLPTWNEQGRKIHVDFNTRLLCIVDRYVE